MTIICATTVGRFSHGLRHLDLSQAISVALTHPGRLDSTAGGIFGRGASGVGADDIDAKVLDPADLNRRIVDFPESISVLLRGTIDGDSRSSPQDVFLAIDAHREHRIWYLHDPRRAGG